MNVRTACFSAVMLSLAAATAAAAVPAAVPLDAGTYVLDGAGARCEDVPNAGTVYFDGANLIGPHDHASHSVVASVSRDGATYVLETRYLSYGADGAKAGETRRDVLRIEGRTRFHLSDGASHADKGEYHRCGPVPKLG